MANRKGKGKGEDVGQRLTEMLDQEHVQDLSVEPVKSNTPPPDSTQGQSLQQLESSLINDYNRVDQQEKSGTIDQAFVQDLASKFLAVAENPELRNKVSFDAARAYEVLYDLASGQQRDTVEEVWHIRRVRYK